ncbi:carboxymuconolactone decarboxylase family protein, partial [Streptomyces sp. G44]|uniref:carboxymuconolactone decarboxylase family protein n=1 Tax=Streptomyces sp. G44 TaxID=2807632 RepID=UPI00195FA91E
GSGGGGAGPGGAGTPGAGGRPGGGAGPGGEASPAARPRPTPPPFAPRSQASISRYAWGEIWTDPTLSHRERSMITLTALVAHGHLAELAPHVRAARRNGLTPEEIGAVLLQTAVYCGVPAADAAFGVAQRALAEEEEATGPETRG